MAPVFEGDPIRIVSPGWVDSRELSVTPPKVGSERLFFALWPQPAVRSALAVLTHQEPATHGRPVVAANLHLTLAFLGGCSPSQRACAEAAATGIAGRRFGLTLNHLGYWRRTGVVWSAPEATPVALVELATTLTGALAECGFGADPRRFRAHVTLARRVSGRYPSRPHPPIRWPVDAFCLVASDTRPEGAQYRVLGRWRLSPVP